MYELLKYGIHLMNIKQFKPLLEKLRPSSLKALYGRIKSEYNSGPRGKSRVIIISISAVFVLDYFMISYHVGSSIFNVFPKIPVIESKKIINIYIPSVNSEKIISEKREIKTDVDPLNMVSKLFRLVAKGSFYENTAVNVPANLVIKKVWIVKSESGAGNDCYIDILPVILEKDVPVVKGSEKMLRIAVEKTIKENIPGINKVMILEKGIPFKPLWEM